MLATLVIDCIPSELIVFLMEDALLSSSLAYVFEQLVLSLWVYVWEL